MRRHLAATAPAARPDRRRHLPAGTFRQRTEISPAQQDILEQLGIDPPSRIYQLTRAATGWPAETLRPRYTPSIQERAHSRTLTGSTAGPEAPDREALRERVRAAGQLRRIGVNPNQAVAKLNATGQRPGDLLRFAREAMCPVGRPPGRLPFAGGLAVLITYIVWYLIGLSRNGQQWTRHG
jgi:hypothetical protein